jgi:hypothetical protein
MSSEARTDDLGCYRIVGLTPRDYMVDVDLELQDRDIGTRIGSGATSMMYRPVARISFSSGDTARKRDAKSFKLGPGEERTGEDIGIPLSKLHTISGELLAAHDGHVLTRGKVQLLDAEDKTEIETTTVDARTAGFTFS